MAVSSIVGKVGERGNPGAKIKPSRACISAQAFLFLLFVLLLTPLHADWPAFKYDNARTGHNPGEALVLPLTLKWENEVLADNICYSSPAVSDGHVYVGLNNGKLYSLSATDGSVENSFATSGPLYSSPSVDADVELYLDYERGRTGGIMEKST